jgi:DNA-3-methyladenine glycosylase II
VTDHAAQLSQDPVMGALMAAAGGYDFTLRAGISTFHTLARAIAHQQLNGKAAQSILNRFVERCGAGAFPDAERVLALPEGELRASGFSFSKIAALKDLAAKAISGVVPERDELHALSDDTIVERLTQVRGIGRWTVEMLLIFDLGRPDVLPVDDFGVRNGFRLAYGLKSMPAPKALAAFGERWRPFRSAAAWYLWRAVDLAREGRLPPPVEKVKLPVIRRRRRRAKPAAKTAAARSVRSRRTPRTAAPRRAVAKAARRTVRSSAASSAPRARSGARTRARPHPARRSRAPSRRKRK